MSEKMTTKPLFLYIKGTQGIPVKKIEEAGFVCIPVEGFDSYEIVEPRLQGQSGMLAQCAYETLMKEAYPNKDKFAHRVLGKLAKQVPVPE